MSSTFQAFSPAANSYLPGVFTNATIDELNAAATIADRAFTQYRGTSAASRAAFLDAIAEQIMALGEALVQRACAESGLPAARITGERGRTCAQLRSFANLLRDGWYVDARIDPALPDREPAPRPDLRRMLVPIGPVAVYGASNFPLAFSTAGGDTASALAAGCPVIVKAHPSHPGTNELVTAAIRKAADRTGMPEGVFTSLHLSNEDSLALVKHPLVKAAGFTGSRRVGMILFRAAMEREQPIPFYGELSAVNPVVILEGALRANGDKIAAGLAASVTLGVGQFCTNPGLVFLPATEAAENFINAFAARLSATSPGTMLNAGICKSYASGVEKLEQLSTLSLVGRSEQDAVAERHEGRPIAFKVAAADFLADEYLQEELFGPATLLVLCRDNDQLSEVLRSLDGQLTASVHASAGDETQLPALVDLLTEKVGRVIYNGFPTGVEVSPAMQHGGPFPSTTDSRSTSVGTAAIYRFLRPVSYQDVPDALLPDALKASNPLGIPRLIDGRWSRA